MKLVSLAMDDENLAHLEGKKIVRVLLSKKRDHLLFVFGDKTFVVFTGMPTDEPLVLDTIYTTPDNVIGTLTQDDVGFSLEQLHRVGIITKKQYVALEKDKLLADPKYQEYLELKEMYEGK